VNEIVATKLKFWVSLLHFRHMMSWFGVFIRSASYPTRVRSIQGVRTLLLLLCCACAQSHVTQVPADADSNLVYAVAVSSNRTGYPYVRDHSLKFNSTTSQEEESGTSSNTAIMVGTVVGATVGLVILVALCFAIHHKCYGQSDQTTSTAEVAFNGSEEGVDPTMSAFRLDVAALQPSGRKTDALADRK